MSAYKKYLLLGLFLCPIFFLMGQNMPKKELDSMEAIIFSLEKKDTANILRLGNYIIENTPSEKQRYKILQKISESYFRTNEVDKSIAYLFKAKEVAEDIDDPELLAQAYGSIANQYSYLKLNEKARPYLNQAIEQIEKLPEGDKKHRLRALSAIEMGNLDFNVGNFAQANKNYRKSLEEFNKVHTLEAGNLYHYRRSLYNIGNSYYYLKAPDSAAFYLQRALDVTDPQSSNLKYYIYSTLSEVYSLKGNNKQAIDTLQVVLSDTNFNIPSLKSEMYLNLSKNYKVLGDVANYTHYNEKYLALQEELKVGEMKAISTAFDVEQKDFKSSIALSRQRNQWLIIGIIIIVFLSGGSIFYLNRKKKKEREIYESIIEQMENKITVIPEKKELPLESETVNNIPSAVENDILVKLKKFEKSKKFRNPKLTITTLAVQLKTNPTYLSSIINSHTKTNFNTYINELRIRYICDKIHTHPEYLNYKISYLAADCGFVSHSTFSTVFKNVTGISPSVFLREEEKYHAAKSLNKNF